MYELHDVYRALSVLAEESDFIQSAVYKNSLGVIKRNNHVLYYDCTNYYFEIEQEDGDKKYGKSKEHRPNPIIQMGLFTDGDGIPLAFSLNLPLTARDSAGSPTINSWILTILPMTIPISSFTKKSLTARRSWNSALS